MTLVSFPCGYSLKLSTKKIFIIVEKSIGGLKCQYKTITKIGFLFYFSLTLSGDYVTIVYIVSRCQRPLSNENKSVLGRELSLFIKKVGKQAILVAQKLDFIQISSWTTSIWCYQLLLASLKPWISINFDNWHFLSLIILRSCKKFHYKKKRSSFDEFSRSRCAESQSQTIPVLAYQLFWASLRAQIFKKFGSWHFFH